MLMIRPYCCAFIAGSAAFVSRNGAVRFTSSVARHGGVVHENVDATEALEGAPHDILGNALRADVAGNGERALPERVSDRHGALAVADIHGDGRAALVESLGGRAPKPARGAGD